MNFGGHISKRNAKYNPNNPWIHFWRLVLPPGQWLQQLVLLLLYPLAVSSCCHAFWENPLLVHPSYGCGLDHGMDMYVSYSHQNMLRLTNMKGWESKELVLSDLDFQVALVVKNLPASTRDAVWSLGQEDSLGAGMATHSNILAWRIPWTEELDRLQSIGSHRVGYNWSGLACMHYQISW